MSQSHREVIATWHAECWAEVGRSIAESRRRSEDRMQAEVRAFAAANGLPDPYEAAS